MRNAHLFRLSELFLLCLLTTMAMCSVGRADLTGSDLPANAVWLESLDLGKMGQGWGSPQVGMSVDKNPITLNGVVYQHGVGTHANSELRVDLKGAALRFDSVVGVDDERKGSGSLGFEVWVDGKKLVDTGVLRGGPDAKQISVNLTAAKTMVLVVNDGGDGIDSDHADWAGAMIVLKPDMTTKPEACQLPVTPTVNIIHSESPKPSINGPRVVGATPGRDFLFLIPATGKAPLTFSAKGLPAGLALDTRTGVISGSLQKAGRTVVELTAKNTLGTAMRKLEIVGGEGMLAQTPPMGWNSWNVWAGAVSDQKVRDAADAMVKSGLAAHGFQYVNIDDCWEAGRDENGEIQTNSKFPDMKALADYVHSKGLKLGIYSSPGPKTCGGYTASYQHEEQDAKTWAKWGIDYVKYDWCSYGGVPHEEGLPGFQKPYIVMRDALDKCGRDIVYSLCQYGMGAVWEWGAKIGGNCWRTTGDINDSWGSLNGIAFSQDGHEKGAGPGHWNDPDMLVVGKVGWGPSLHPTRLTPNEQLLHISMWSLLSSPLLIGCDMTAMDDFTRALLTNDEVLEVNQDPLGKPAGRKAKDGQAEVWARPLWDGTTAVGLFNRGMWEATVTAKWSDLGLRGTQPVRDLWQRKSLGKSTDSFTAKVPAHGVVFVKIGKPNRVDW